MRPEKSNVVIDLPKMMQRFVALRAEKEKLELLFQASKSRQDSMIAAAKKRGESRCEGHCLAMMIALTKRMEKIEAELSVLLEEVTAAAELFAAPPASKTRN